MILITSISKSKCVRWSSPAFPSDDDERKRARIQPRVEKSGLSEAMGRWGDDANDDINKGQSGRQVIVNRLLFT